MRLSELREKEIINICTCEKLGCATDLCFDLKSCRIQSLIVSQGTHFLNLFEQEEIVIPWECIKQIGTDIILVEHSVK